MNVTSGIYDGDAFESNKAAAMPFHNELSNEIAIALMTRGDQSTADLKKLKDVVLTVHETLRQLEDEAARRSGKNQESAATANDQHNNG